LSQAARFSAAGGPSIAGAAWQLQRRVTWHAGSTRVEPAPRRASPDRSIVRFDIITTGLRGHGQGIVHPASRFGKVTAHRRFGTALAGRRVASRHPDPVHPLGCKPEKNGRSFAI